MANDAKFNFYLNRSGPRGQKGEKGDQGFSPSITVNTNTEDEYTLLIQNEYDSFVTDNIRPTYDDRGGTYVRVDRDNNVQYFGSADIATTANYGEVKLATEEDVATGSTTGNDSNVVTAGILKGVKVNILADTVTLTTDQTITGFKTFDKGLYANNIIQARGELSYYSQTYNKKVFEAVNDSVTIDGSLAVDGDVTFYGNINTASGVRANFQSITAKSVKVNNKDVATADTVDAMQSDLNIAKQDIIEAQGDIDNLQMNKQNKLTAGTGITIDADNVISATGGVVDLPIASSTTLGGIKVGENLTISEDGTLSATGGGGGGVTYTAEAPLSISADNVISIDTTGLGGTTLRKDGISIDYELNLTANGTVGGSSKAARAESNESGHDAYKAFSGHSASDAISNLWGPSSRKTNSWVELYVPEGIIPASAAWTYGSTQEILPAVELLASNNGQNYTSLGSVEGISTVTSSMMFNATDSYKYLRFKFKDACVTSAWGKFGLTSLKVKSSKMTTYTELLIGDNIDVTNGTMNVNLDEIDDLSTRVTTAEGNITTLQGDINNKQDKLTAISPVNIATKVLSPTEGWAVSSSSMQSIYKEHVVNNGNNMSGSHTTMQLSSDSEYPIKSYVAMPYSVGQVVKYRQNRSRSTLTTLVLGDIIDGKIYPILISSATGDYYPDRTTALFDGTQELTKEVMTNGISYSSKDEPGPYGQSFINEATFGCLQNTGTKLIWHVFTPRNNTSGDYGNLTYTNFNGYTIDDLVGKIKYAIILAGSTSLAYTPDQFGVYENTLSSYSNISNYQALSPNLFDLSKDEVQTQISTLPATISSLGVVKPDGTTITITDDGTISAVGGGVVSREEFDALVARVAALEASIKGSQSA